VRPEIQVRSKNKKKQINKQNGRVLGHVHIRKRKLHFSKGSHKIPIPPSGKYFTPNSSSQLQGVRIKTQFALRYKSKLSVLFSAIWQCTVTDGHMTDV